MKLRRITRIRHGNTSYRFVNAETGALYRNSKHAYTHAVVGRMDDDQRLVPFSFHATENLAHAFAMELHGLDDVEVVAIEVEPS